MYSKRKLKNLDLYFVFLKLRRGGINWELFYFEGEDEVLMERYKEVFRMEVCCRILNWDKVGKGMVFIFFDRRWFMNKKVVFVDV